MAKRRRNDKPTRTLAAGYRSIPAVTSPKTRAEMREIVHDEHVAREHRQGAPATMADHAALVRVDLSDHAAS